MIEFSAVTISCSKHNALHSKLIARRSLLIVFFSLLVILSTSLSAQTSNEPRLSTEPLYLIDLPTAGILYKSNYATSLEFLDKGGLTVTAQAGFFDRLMVGLSFGGTNIIGVEKTMFDPHLGILIRVRAAEESYYIPAVTFGFSSQGKGTYIDSSRRYATKSPGFYGVASKNFEALGFLSIHAGFHYSLEESENKTLNFFLGVEKTFLTLFSGMAEYDNGFSLTGSRLDNGHGLFNLGLRAAIGNGFRLGLNLKDIVKNQQDVSIGERTVQIEYMKTF